MLQWKLRFLFGHDSSNLHVTFLFEAIIVPCICVYYIIAKLHLTAFVVRIEFWSLDMHFQVLDSGISI